MNTKSNLLKSIFISLILLMGVNNAWGNVVSSPRIYYDNTNTSYEKVAFMVGHNSYSRAYKLTKIENTNLWYRYLSSTGNDYWGDATQIAIFGVDWDNAENNNISHRANYTNNNYTTTRTLSNTSGSCNSLDYGNTYLVRSDGNKSTTYIEYHSSGYTALNSQQEIRTVVDGTVANSKATIDITSYEMTDNGKATKKTASVGTGASSSYISAARTATTTLTVGTVATGYQFDGWYTAATGGTQLSSSTTYTYYPTAATTVYARFSEKKYTVTVKNDGHGTTTPSGAQSNVGQVTGLSIKATPAANYEFVNWTITSGSGSFGSTTSASTTFKPTSAATIQANFRSTATYSLTVVAGANIESVAGSEDPVTLGNTYDIEATPKTGYTFSTWTANPAENATFGSATTANTTVTVNNGSVTVTASATETLYAITVQSSDVNHGTVTTSADEAGIATFITITAEPKEGYRFVNWTTKTAGITIANAADASTTVTATAAGTITANFEEIPKETIYFVNKDNWSKVNVHLWGGDKDDTTWPGIEATKADFQLHCCDVYYVSALPGSYNKCIFSNNGSSQTADLDWTAGKYYYNGEWKTLDELTYEVQLAGSMLVNNGNWVLQDMTMDANNSTGSITISLDANKTYKFKIVVDGNWHGNNGIITNGHSTDWTMSTSEGDCQITTTAAGEYTFTYDVCTAKLSVTYPEAYTVTYSRVPEDAANAPTTDPSITSGALVLSGTSVTFTAQNAKTGYTWKGWYDNSEGTGTTLSRDKAYERTINDNTTIYAVYTTDTYDINYITPTHGTFTIQVGSNTPVNANTTADYKTTITLSNTPDPGYHFSSWNITPSVSITNSKTFLMPASNVTIGVTFAANTYKVKFNKNANDATGSMSDQSFTYDEASKALTANAFTRTGYTFTGWNTNANGSGTAYNDGQSVQNLTDVDNGTINLYAQWTEKLSTITITVSEGGSVKVDGEDFESGNTVQVGVATSKTITLHPNAGYGISGFGVTGDAWIAGNETYTLTATGNEGIGTLYANFIGLEYTITFDKQEGTNGTDNVTVRYKNNNYSVSPVVAPTRTGYTFGGYYTEADGDGVQVVSAAGQWLANATGYTDADRKWLVHENTTLYAKWTANTYTVTLNQEGAATSGTEEVTATYDAAMPTADVTMPTAQNGYAFMGYFDQIDGKGTQYYNADGTSAHVWDKVGEATLYAYFAVPKIEVTLDKSTFEPGAENVTATATVTPTPAGTTTICWKLLYTNDNPVDNHAPSPENGNSVQFNISDLVAGTYKIKATLRMGDGCEGEEICSSEHTFLISSSHTITIKYICDGKEIQSKTTIEANVSSTTTYTAPDIVGYTFSTWEAGDGVTITATNGKEVTFNAFYDGYLTAKYTKNSNIIYFYNTLGWENVYVYFYNDANGYKYWTDNYGTGAHQNKDFGAWDRKPFWEMEHGQMQQIEGTNIWYFQMENKRSKVAFATVNQTYKEGDNVSNTTAYFQNAEVVYRDDLDSEGRLPMFVPNPTISHDMTNTKSKYYNHGYWMNYPENTGYTLDLFNHHSDNDPARYFIYPYSKNTIFPLQLEVEINAENVVEGAKKIWFRIHRNDGKNFGGHATNFPRVNPTTTGGFIEENNYKVELITPIAGTYTFTLDYRYNEKTKDYQYHIEVDYPAKVGDYRILYRDEAETNWSGNTKPVGWYHPSRVIKKGEDRKDIISFYINKDVERSLSYQTIKSINNETGAITWNTTEVQFSTIDWSQITKSGVYNFVFVQDGKGISVENDIVPYTGNYYIRTDAMGGGWEDYKTNSENRMTYSSFSESDANSFGEQFSHYAVKWCEAGTNVKFTIANDYSHCISDTLAQDIIPLGNLTDEGTLLNNDIYDANIRFMWNRKTNKISRAYVGPAGDKQSQFLMLQSCSEFKDAAGNDLNPAEGDILDKEKNIYAARFTDTQNWIYERTIQVKPRTRVKLYASYPNGYHIYIENNTGWKDVALYAFKNDGGEPLGTWPGVQPTRTVKIGDKTYYDFPVNKYVFGSTLIFNNNVKENGQQTSNYTDFATVGDYYLTASSNNQLSFVKNVSTTVEATAQYFRGAYAEGSCDNENTVQILGGEGDTWNTIRVIYDFKTNRLMAAWMPNNNAIDTRSIESDVMIIRDHQNAAQCITFANDESELTEVKTVYGVMRFNRWILNNRGGEKNLNIESCTKVVDNQTVYDQETTNKNHPVLDSNKQKSQYERALYFISFPFDVHLSDVFGFGTYGQHWIIEYYDGLKRAREGYWIDSDPNWKYVTNPTDFVLKAYEGYILCLNLGKMAYDNTDFWAHNISQVELFFPSFTTMDKISKIEVTMPSLGEEYLCTINRGEGTEGDRRVKDSYWRCIGVPSYANYSNVLKDEEGNDIRWQTSYKTFPFLYAWNMTDNTLTPQSTSNFPFKTMHAYLVQNGGEIHWSAVSATPEPASIVARKEAPSNNYEWKITLTRNEQVEDQAFIRLSNDEKITNNFDFNQDLSKEFNYGRSDIYTLIGYEKAAANSLPISEQTTVIPLGLSIEYNGDYTLAMPDRVNGIGVTLVDNQTGTRTNLSAGMDYTLTLNKGDYNNRFFIEISPVQQVPTDIEYVTGDTNSQDTVRKVLIDNILYIVRDGQIFDARGARVK